MEKIWKWIILSAIVIVCGLFTLIAWDSSVIARWIMLGVDTLVVGFIGYKFIKSKREKL